MIQNKLGLSVRPKQAQYHTNRFEAPCSYCDLNNLKLTIQIQDTLSHNVTMVSDSKDSSHTLLTTSSLPAKRRLSSETDSDFDDDQVCSDALLG